MGGYGGYLDYLSRWEISVADQTTHRPGGPGVYGNSLANDDYVRGFDGTSST